MQPVDLSRTGGALAALRRMLIVEDEFLLRLDLAEALRGNGWEVVEAANADEALALLERDQNFQLILTDVHMPGVSSGMDLARHVKNRWSEIMVVVMSGQHRPAPEEQKLVDQFLMKPVRDIVSVLSPIFDQSS